MVSKGRPARPRNQMMRNYLTIYRTSAQNKHFLFKIIVDTLHQPCIMHSSKRTEDFTMMNEFGCYDPYYDLTETELKELNEWFDSVDTPPELCQTIVVDFDPNEDIPF
jgi:hypothetical protein